MRDVKINDLRDLLGLHAHERVEMMLLDGYESIPDPDTHEMTMKYVRTEDRAVVLVGPVDQLDGRMTVDQERGTTTVTFTFPSVASV